MSAPVWVREGRDWPNRAYSRFVRAGGLLWHVQVAPHAAPTAPVLLLLHGTGAATHSWAGLLPLLARDATVIAPDLPGHGFTGAPDGGGPPARLLTLPGMARGVAELLRVLGLRPDLAIGHSAGGAIGLRMALDGWIAPRGVVALNGALLPLRSMPGVFAPLARLLAGLPLVPELVAWRADDPALVARLLRGTGSRIGPVAEAHYARLIRTSRHVGAALGMMAGWDLDPLARDLPRLAVPLLLVIGEGDRTVPPAEQRRVLDLLPRVAVASLPNLGHLAHEEAPERVAALIAERSLAHA